MARGKKEQRLTNVRKKLVLLREALKRDSLYPSADNAGFKLPGISHDSYFDRKNFENWCRGQGPEYSIQKLSRAVAEHYQIQDKNTGQLVDVDFLGSESGTGITTVGKWLKFDNSEIAYQIDKLYGELFPTLTMFSLENDNALSIMEQYGGLYMMYRVDGAEKDQTYVTQIPLSIRYLLPTNKKNALGEYRIRCKARVPSAKGEMRDYEYDGWLSQTTAALFFVFEMRNKSEGQKDMFFISANPRQKNDKGEIFIRGDALSRSMHVEEAQHWPVILVKDENFSTDRPDDSKGYYSLKDARNPFAGDIETTFFDEHCKMIPLEAFENTTVLQYLLKRNKIRVYPSE